MIIKEPEISLLYKSFTGGRPRFENVICLFSSALSSPIFKESSEPNKLSAQEKVYKICSKYI